MAGKSKSGTTGKAAPKVAPKVKKKPKPAAAAAPKLKAIPFWIGFDLGGTKMLACVLDKDYNVLGTARKSTNGSDGQAKGRKKIVNCVHEAILSAGVDPKGIQGIGIGCPGLVNPERGVLLVAPNLGWHNMGLSALLTKEFGAPVSVLNDVDAGTFGEYKLGAAMGARSVLGVFPGTGVGAGFVYNGQLVMGRTISCMELGNVMLPGTHLGSTEFGTVILEDMTSRLAVAAQAGVGCYRGQAPELNRRTAGNLRDIRSKAIATSMKSADAAMVTVMRNSIRYLGMGVAMVVNLFAPDQIVLGGGLVEEMPTVYLTMLKEEVARYAMPELAKGLKYSIAKLSGTAVAVGSVAWLRNGEKV